MAHDLDPANPSTAGGRVGVADGDLTPPELLAEVASDLSARARAGEQIDVMLAHSRSTSIRVYDADVESLTSAESFGAGVRVVVAGPDGPRQGFAHAGSLAPDVLAATLADARDNAQFGAVDAAFGLGEPDDLTPVEIEHWDERLAGCSTSEKIECVLALERAVRGADPRVAGVRTAAWGDSAASVAFAASNGVVRFERGASCSISAQPMAKADGETQIGAAVDVGRWIGELDVERVVSDSVERATRLLGARPGATATLTLLLEPRHAATFWGLISSVLDGESVLKGRSPFSDRLGETIASPLVRLSDDPTRTESLGASGWDGEGFATRPNGLIDGGRLVQFLHNSYTARRAGTSSTASAVRGSRSLPGVGAQLLVLEPGEGSWDELVSGIDLGMVVNSFSGLHSGVNTTSGDFSVGVDGLMIRHGELAEPVREMTAASTLQRMLLDVVAVGADTEVLVGGDIMSAIAIDGVAVGGV